MNYFVVAFLGIILALGLSSVIMAILKAVGIITISWWWVAVPAAIFCVFVAWLGYVFVDGLRYIE